MAKVKSIQLKFKNKIIGFFSKSTYSLEKTNIIVLLILLCVSSVIYFLYNFLQSYLPPIDFSSFSCLFYLFVLNISGVLLLGGLYFNVNFSKKNKGKRDKTYTILGCFMILSSILVLLESYLFRFELFIPNAISLISTIVVFLVVFPLWGADEFSVKQLIILYFAHIICIVIFIIVMIIITVTIFLTLLAMAGDGDSSSSSGSLYMKTGKKYKIKQNKNDLSEGELLDENNNPVRNTIGTPVMVTEINELSHTAKIDDEDINWEDKK